MNPWIGKRVLVTGGAGFLGSHLCERLIGAGNEVICVDNFFTGSRSNVAHLFEEPRFELWLLYAGRVLAVDPVQSSAP